MTVIRTIWRSKIMTLGVSCEILAFIAAVLNWFFSTWPAWVPNATLTLATLGAFIVACKVAWDYHGRGLNGRQREEVNETLSSSSLNTAQKEEVTQITESSGLNPHQREAVNETLLSTSLNKAQRDAVAQIIENSGLSPRQVSELPAKLMRIYLSRIASAQQAAVTASDYLYQTVHGRVAVLRNAGTGLVEVQCIDPPQEALNCERQHDREDGNSSAPFEIASAHLEDFAGDTVIWRPPGNRGLRYVNANTEPPISIDGRSWVFSTEDCVPKRLDPRSDDYVLTRDRSGCYAWVKKS